MLHFVNTGGSYFKLYLQILHLSGSPQSNSFIRASNSSSSSSVTHLFHFPPLFHDLFHFLFSLFATFFYSFNLCLSSYFFYSAHFFSRSWRYIRSFHNCFSKSLLLSGFIFFSNSSSCCSYSGFDVSFSPYLFHIEF